MTTATRTHAMTIKDDLLRAAAYIGATNDSPDDEASISAVEGDRIAGVLRELAGRVVQPGRAGVLAAGAQADVLAPEWSQFMERVKATTTLSAMAEVLRAKLAELSAPGVLGTEQIHPFWCHEQSHDRPRCITQCSECADDGDGVDTSDKAEQHGPLLTFSLAYIDGVMKGENAEVRRHWARIRSHVSGVRVPSAPRFDKTYCSQCGGEFGPGDEGYSHCKDHQREATNDLQA